MRRGFELFVALRYLTAKRKQAVISVITAISVLGVAAGVMALVIALAINTGFRNTLQRNLLGATGHVILLEKTPSTGIAGWESLAPRLARVDGVVNAAPTLWGPVMFMGVNATGGHIKGVLPPDRSPAPLALRQLVEGEFKNWEPVRGLPPIILGKRLARQTGMKLGSVLRVVSPQGEMTPVGNRLVEHSFRVTGIFESGFLDLDNQMAFTSISSAQRVMGIGNVVNAIELWLADIYRAPEVGEAATRAAGEGLASTTWMEQNAQILSALEMEKKVTIVTIGLIQIVAALNILVSLVMMVMEKHRDIAILMAMGTRRAQIMRIFLYQGLLIGVTGLMLGLAAGYSLCYFADRGRWIELDAAVYSLSFVPFEPQWSDSIWIAGIALSVSFSATLYPARAATRVAPAEALRYE